MLRKNIIIGISVCFLFACSSNKGIVSKNDAKTKKEQGKVSYSGKAEEAIPVLWHQTSAEYKALCYQAYNVARMHVDKYLERYRGDERPGIIVMDIDETILDNSKYSAFLTLNKKKHTEELWKEWVGKSVAETVPGAKEFLQYVVGNGLKVFFISNRLASTKDFTMVNFTENEIPFDDRDFLLATAPGDSKIQRRKAIEGAGQIVLYIGDNLADFSDVYEMEKTLEARDKATQALKDEFGIKYILLPNILYGGWRNALENEGGSMLKYLEAY